MSTSDKPSYNFRMADWQDFTKNLEIRLTDLACARPLYTKDEIFDAAHTLKEVLQDTIRTRIKLQKPLPDKKRWWTGELEDAKRQKNRLGSMHHKLRTFDQHPCHQQFKEAKSAFAKLVIETKQKHWNDWLSEASTKDLWTANKYLRNPTGDGGQPRIPTLEATDPYTDEKVEIATNEEKARMFATTFFPRKPEHSNVPADFDYPAPVPDAQSPGNKSSDK
ncbi:LOW QUALITY PROTEIN: hypothetical protein CVT25_013227 [Psilocybe cyanescens]|uniref:Uncharacterized protein n=1 Tax=Psilocybe cyanescens TaxID=93625 RepID=A0A409X0R1_PSICY|nr:LOW QUALITY PROTEIN: hypothetical protein CVT25_013227 [Psilocybe cyanescens]